MKAICLESVEAVGKCGEEVQTIYLNTHFNLFEIAGAALLQWFQPFVVRSSRLEVLVAARSSPEDGKDCFHSAWQSSVRQKGVMDDM